MSEIRAFLEADHRRLEALFERACADPAPTRDGEGANEQRAAYDEFRAGLLRHIAMEEKVLLAEARRLRGGAPLAVAAQLRLDHAAIAAMLAAPPDAEIVRELRALLALHDGLEEGERGMYAQCEELAGDGVGALLDRVRAVPPVRVAQYANPDRIRGELRRTLAAAQAGREAK